MRRRVGLAHLARTFAVVLRVVLASAVAAAAAFGAWYALDDALGRGLVAQLVSLGSAFAVGGLVYIGLGRALGLRELEALLLLRARRDDSSDSR
jgi:predicted membrane protein